MQSLNPEKKPNLYEKCECKKMFHVGITAVFMNYCAPMIALLKMTGINEIELGKKSGRYSFGSYPVLSGFNLDSDLNFRYLSGSTRFLSGN